MKCVKTYILHILIILPILILILISGCINKNENDKQLENTDKNITNSTSNITNAQPIVFKVVCEGCHLSGKSNVPQALTVEPHKNGGNYCLTCHHFSHDNHPINKDVTCEKCHGVKNESIPVPGPNIVCINCHDYPNPLNKSFGNLITIHRERNISCINCHADTCTKCHKEMGTNERWQKRLIHFKTILGAIPNDLLNNTKINNS